MRFTTAVCTKLYESCHPDLDIMLAYKNGRFIPVSCHRSPASCERLHLRTKQFWACDDAVCVTRSTERRLNLRFATLDDTISAKGLHSREIRSSRPAERVIEIYSNDTPPPSNAATCQQCIACPLARDALH